MAVCLHLVRFFFLCATLVCSQRVELFSSSMNISADLADWNVTESVSISSAEECPLYSECLTVSGNQESILFLSSAGYNSTRVSFDLRSAGFSNNAVSSGCWIWSCIASGCDDWNGFDQESRFASNGLSQRFSENLITDRDDADRIGISFYTQGGASDVCYFNNVVVSGVALPTPSPTAFPSATPSDHPFADPTSDPTSNPSQAPTSDPTRAPTMAPSAAFVTLF